MATQTTRLSSVYKLVIVGMLAWALLGTVIAASYYMSYTTSVTENAEMKARIGVLQGDLHGVEGLYAELLGNVTFVTVYIDYGNGTVAGYTNVTVSSVHPTLLLALMSVADVDLQVYAGLGVLVTGINGVSQSLEESKFWLFYVYKEGKGWVTPDPFVGADKYRPASGSSVSWNLTASPF